MGPVVEKGIISVELVNQGPKDLKTHSNDKAKKPAAKPQKRFFSYPTPEDLTMKDLAPNKPKNKEGRRKERRSQREEARDSKEPEDTTPAGRDQSFHGATSAGGWPLEAHLLHL